MASKQPRPLAPKLEDLPNIGRQIAVDLRAIGVHTPADLASQDPLTTYWRLASQTGSRHDPCHLYTLLACEHYARTGERLPWWRFTEAGKALLGQNVPVNRRASS